LARKSHRRPRAGAISASCSRAARRPKRSKRRCARRTRDSKSTSNRCRGLGQEVGAMLEFSEKARAWIAKIIDAQPEKDYSVRLAVTGRSAGGFQYDMGLMELDEAKPDDVIVDNG